LWPIQTTRFPFVTIARWIGEPITQYGDILAEEGHARFRWRKAAEQVILRWSDVDLFMFALLRADGVFVRSGRTSDNGTKFHVAPYVDLQGSLSPPHRHKSLERRARQLAKLGEIRFSEITEPDQREEMTRLAIAMKLSWLRSQRLLSMALSNLTVTHFLIDLARTGYLRIHCVWVNNRVAAIELGFGGAIHRSLLGCFDLEFAEGSPGHTLTSRLIHRLRTEGAAGLDLLWPADGYKFNFATGATPIGAQVIPMTLRGRAAAFLIEFLRPLVKQSFAMFFMPWKREERLVRRH
jgi:CelD/BcsL family acetyltransferase involved in cellulose biosynthesis